MKRLIVMAALALLSLVVETMIQPSRLNDNALKASTGTVPGLGKIAT